MDLTPRQLEILRFIPRFRQQNGYGPTLEEIAQELGVSKVTVHEHVGHLRKKRVLAGSRGARRGLDLSAAARRWLDIQDAPVDRPTAIPLAGVIAAGQPLEAVDADEVLDVADWLEADGGTFALRVRGDSMIEDQIRDGDFVIVQRQTEVRNGQIAVAVLPNGEATLKRLYRERGRIRLQPSNSTMDPIYVTGDVDVQGIVIGVMRKYR
jgi:repressor LexA